MADSKPPEQRSGQATTRIRVLPLAGGAAYLLFGLALWGILELYIDPQTSTQRKSLALALALVMAGVAGVVGIYFTWRGKRRVEQVRQQVHDTQKRPHTAFPANDKEAELIWDFYTELGTIQARFNTLQAGYRALTSTWMLAAFAAAGFVLSTELPPPVPTELVIVGIGLCAGIGISLLWVLDLLVTQRLVDAAFIELLHLERNNKWLPQVRNNMRAILRGKGMLLVVPFYVATTEVMALLGGVGLLLWLIRTTTSFAITCLITVDYVIGMILVSVYMVRRTATTPQLEALLEEQGQQAQDGTAGGIS